MSFGDGLDGILKSIKTKSSERDENSKGLSSNKSTPSKVEIIREGYLFNFSLPISILDPEISASLQQDINEYFRTDSRTDKQVA